MHWSDLFRSFIPRQNPIGFSAADFLEFAWIVVLVAGTVAWRPWIEPLARKVAHWTWLSMLLLAALPVALRLVLLPSHPVPTPEIYDETSHLLVADTLRHLRLANPMHPLHQFFETFFVLQEPVYASIYPLGQGAMLALGRALLGLPWAGVLLDTALFCALSYWMLRGWIAAEWALLGGLLAVAEFGPLCYWMNSYWGGTLAAIAGCLIFGALPRLRAEWRGRDAMILGPGLSVHWLVRPFETIFLCLGVILYFLPVIWKLRPWRQVSQVALIASLTAIPAIALTLAHDKRVTGEWFTLPEMLSQRQYGIPAALTFQADPVPHRALTPEQDMEYKMQMSFKGVPAETSASYWRRLQFRARFYRFFFLTPLYIVLPLFFTVLTEWSLIWVAVMLGIYAAGINFFPAYQHHYLGGVACLFLLISVVALRRLSSFTVGREAARLVILFCAAHFVFWYGVHLIEPSGVAQSLRPYETWPGINHYPDRRQTVRDQLAGTPGKLLVFVRYYRPQHVFQDEWVYNEADIDSARVVWARDLGTEEDDKLIRYYTDRSAWLLEPEFRPARLRKYEKPAPAPPVSPTPPAAGHPAGHPLMRLLPVPGPK